MSASPKTLFFFPKIPKPIADSSSTNHTQGNLSTPLSFFFWLEGGLFVLMWVARLWFFWWILGFYCGFSVFEFLQALTQCFFFFLPFWFWLCLGFYFVLLLCSNRPRFGFSLGNFLVFAVSGVLGFVGLFLPFLACLVFSYFSDCLLRKRGNAKETREIWVTWFILLFAFFLGRAKRVREPALSLKQRKRINISFQSYTDYLW